MPKIAEIKAIDGQIWCRVGRVGEFENGIAIMTPDEQKAKYDAGYRDGKEDAALAVPDGGWMDISTCPIDGTAFLVCGGFWHGEVNSEADDEYDVAKVTTNNRAYFPVCDTDIYSAWISDPIKWMPLPNKPKGGFE